jgi:hypothetical protein
VIPHAPASGWEHVPPSMQHFFYLVAIKDRTRQMLHTRRWRRRSRCERLRQLQGGSETLHAMTARNGTLAGDVDATARFAESGTDIIIDPIPIVLP